MKEIEGNIWDFNTPDNLICIPTNLGYKPGRFNNEDIYINVMGAGLAKQFKAKYPAAPATYGAWCKQRHDNGNTGQLLYYLKIAGNNAKFIMFPTKPLITNKPSMSWDQKSDLDLIISACEYLLIAFDLSVKYSKFKTYIPLVGCGNGELSEDVVLPVLRKYFIGFDNIILIHPDEKVKNFK